MSDERYSSKKVTKTQSALRTINNKQAQRSSELSSERERNLRHAINTMIRDVLERLEEAGVTKSILGYLTE